SCSPSVAADFDRALALLHNFWYGRALEAFDQIIRTDSECAMAYWGAAMTYNHPFWDAPTREDRAAAWAQVQKGTRAAKQTAREKMYLEAVAELYKDAGTGPKSERDEAYRNAMKAIYEKHQDDETRLFYGLSILGTIREGTPGFERQAIAARLFEEVYARSPEHPGALHYLIHVYDDPEHAEDGLKVARAYAGAAAAVPHAQHMPSHIFTRLGLWRESAATNENAWRTSEEDVKRAGESGAYRDFHSLNYLQYAYLQLGRYRDAKRVTDVIKAQYEALPDRKTAPDTPELQSRHVRGRTIYALPDRVAYGYFDMLTRYLVETGNWQELSNVPMVATSRDFMAMKWQLEAMAAAHRGDAAGAKTAAERVAALSNEPGQHPFVKQILTMQAREAEAMAARAAGELDRAIAKMNEATAVEDAIYALSQPPYPIIPAHELYGTMLLAAKRPAEAMKHFVETLKRTPGRPKAIYGIARAAESLGDQQTARQRYLEFLELWRHADQDRPEIARAQRFLAGPSPAQSRANFTVGPVTAQPGAKASGQIQVQSERGEATTIPISVIHGARPGPVLALVAGNHGYEYTPVIALQRLLPRLDPQQLSGTLILVHVANLPSFLKRTIYYSPGDGQNLNRVYPGRADGTISERIAYQITREVIERADYLLDLHCGDGNESLRPYSYWDVKAGGKEVVEKSRQLALAFGFDRIVMDSERPTDPANSVYCSTTATTRGKPAITIESGGLGVTDDESIARIERGVMNVMRHLKMIEGTPQMVEHPMLIDRSVVLRSDETGIFYPLAEKGHTVTKGTLMGYVTDFFGKRIYELRAPFSGEVLYILGTPPVTKGEPLAMIGHVLEPER
ncbi:MAG TPA: M14 family metallopeptidase, partial [Blastocatellia bacterium]|nr:M14 family metallopeptidase [Blastocatellia bacterium]